MVRTVARYHEEKKLNGKRAKKEEQNKLRRIAAAIASEIDYFWSNIEQVMFSPFYFATGPSNAPFLKTPMLV